MSTSPSSTAKQPNTTTTVAAVGLMLFSMFFGAGNLIFPPMLGVESLSLIHISEPRSLVGSEMCIRDSPCSAWNPVKISPPP